MSPLFVVLLFTSFISIFHAQIFHGSSSSIIGDNSLDITINYDSNIATIIFSGRSGVWNGFAFGRSVMQDAYAIIMEYESDDISTTLISEYILGNHRAGVKLTTTDITLLSDISIGEIRTITIQRSIIGTTYTLSAAASSSDTSLQIDVMCAIGSIPSDYGSSRNAAHTPSNRAAVSVTLNKITTSTTSVPTSRPTAIITTSNNTDTEIIQCEDCASKTIECSANKACFVQCKSEKSCYNTTIRCNEHFECMIEGLNAYALSGAHIEGPTSYDLDIKCLDVFSCTNIVIDASKALSFMMHCDAIKSCQDFEVFCPSNTNSIKNCKISGNTADAAVDSFSVQNTMIIHALNGWNDVDLSSFMPTLLGLDANNIMFCQLDECNMIHNNGRWNCIEQSSLCAINPQISSTNKCANGEISTGESSAQSIDVIATINCIENSITLDVSYKEYNYINGNWFGLVFNTEMFGDALIFTTGQNNDRTAALYAYYINGRNIDDVVYKPAQDWTQLSMVLDFGARGIRIVYQQDLDQTMFNTDTNAIEFNVAIGASLTLQQHIAQTTTTFALNLSPIPTIAPTKLPTNTITTREPTIIPTIAPTKAATTTRSTHAPTIISTVAPTKVPTKTTIIISTVKDSTLAPVTTIAPIVSTTIYTTKAVTTNTESTAEKVSTSSNKCADGEILSGNIATDDLEIKVTLNCVQDSIMMDVTYNGYDDNWFGFVFNDVMFGDAIVYGSHPTNDALTGLYSYEIESKSAKGIIYNEGNDWKEIYREYTDINCIHIVYTQSLLRTNWDSDTKQIMFRYAFGYGSIANIGYHAFRSDDTFIIDLSSKESTSHIICNEVNDCSSTVIECSEDTINDDNICVIECNSSGSCSNTLFECLHGSDCRILCVGDESCKQSTIECGNNAHCEIQAIGEHSVYQTAINGQIIGSSLSIECVADDSCCGALIGGLYTDKLEVICGAKRSCDDVKIQCPQFSESAKCQITGTRDEIAGDGMHMSIFAVNSWLDIDSASYLASGVSLDMFCGLKYDTKCSADLDADWNCADKISQCYANKEGIEIIRCDADADEACINKRIACASDECRIICDGFGSCSGSNILCSNSSTVCEVICNGANACSDTQEIMCGSSKECNVECVGDKACANTNIVCMHNVCNIYGLDDDSLFGANIECMQNTNCSIECEAQATCDSVTFNGKESDFMDIFCHNASCNNIVLFCPSSKCMVSGRSDKRNALQMTIYAQNSWNDVDLSHYVDVVISNESKMICGQMYSDNCRISVINDNNWKCVDAHYESLCYIGDKSTLDAYYSTIFDDDTINVLALNKNQLTRSEYTAIIVVISFVVIIILLLAVYCLCYRQNQPITAKNKYKSVKTKKKYHHDEYVDAYDDDDDETIPIGKKINNKQAIVAIELNANIEQFTANHNE